MRLSSPTSHVVSERWPGSFQNGGTGAASDLFSVRGAGSGVCSDGIFLFITYPSPRPFLLLFASVPPDSGVSSGVSRLTSISPLFYIRLISNFIGSVLLGPGAVFRRMRFGSASAQKACVTPPIFALFCNEEYKNPINFRSSVKKKAQA